MGTTESAVNKLFGNYLTRHALSIAVILFGGGVTWSTLDNSILAAGKKASENAKKIETLRQDYGDIRNQQGITQERVKSLTKSVDRSIKAGEEDRKRNQKVLERIFDAMNRRGQPGGGSR